MSRQWPLRRPAIRNGEESVFCSTALLRSSFISADFSGGCPASEKCPPHSMSGSVP